MSLLSNLRRGVLIVAGLGIVSASGMVVADDDRFRTSLGLRSSFFLHDPLVGEPREQVSDFEFDNRILLDLLEWLRLDVQTYINYRPQSEDKRHQDFRTFQLLADRGDWEFQAGLSQVFWGVVESRNVVDTLGQQDFIADFNGDEKLGQPMVRATWYSSVGTWSAYYLPQFRTPVFTAEEDRPRLPFVLDADRAVFESEDGEKADSAALRWVNTFDVLDIGLHLFSGTDNTARVQITDTGPVPRFIQVEQAGIDAQITYDAMLLKFEGIYQDGDEIRGHGEAVAGLEYTWSQVFERDWDLGLLTEYGWDSRGDGAEHTFENDLMLGVRLALNDENSTALLATVVVDAEDQDSVFNVDFQRRIGKDFTLELEAQVYESTVSDPEADVPDLHLLRKEDSVSLSLKWFF